MINLMIIMMMKVIMMIKIIMVIMTKKIMTVMSITMDNNDDYSDNEYE